MATVTSSPRLIYKVNNVYEESHANAGTKAEPGFDIETSNWRDDIARTHSYNMLPKQEFVSSVIKFYLIKEMATRVMGGSDI